MAFHLMGRDIKKRKKNRGRALALLLGLVLSVADVPLAALAAEPDVEMSLSENHIEPGEGGEPVEGEEQKPGEGGEPVEGQQQNPA